MAQDFFPQQFSSKGNLHRFTGLDCAGRRSLGMLDVSSAASAARITHRTNKTPILAEMLGIIRWYPMIAGWSLPTCDSREHRDMNCDGTQ